MRITTKVVSKSQRIMRTHTHTNTHAHVRWCELKSEREQKHNDDCEDRQYMPSEKENKAEKCLRLVSAQTYFTIPLSLSPTLSPGWSERTISTYNVCAEYVRHTRCISSYVWMKTNAPRRWETKQKSQWWQQNERALRSALQQQRSTAEANANDNSDSGLFLFNDLFLAFHLFLFFLSSL